MNIGNKILKLRKQKGYSQEELANKLNVSRQTVSKWETNQSTPDFDKIVPLCDIFGITTDEFLKNSKVNTSSIEEGNINIVQNDRGFAAKICFSIFLYFVSIMWIIFADYIKVNEELTVVVFLLIAAIATVIIIYSSMVNKSKKKEMEEKKIENRKVKRINDILSLVFLVLYMVLSFITKAWHITWILWVIYAVVCEIVKLIYDLEEDEDE